MSYFGSFLARADSVVSSLFISAWVLKHYINVGKCPDIANEVCRPSVTLSSSITGVGNVAALVGAPIFGILAHKYHRLTAFLIACVIGALGFSSFVFLRKYLSFPSVPCLTLMAGSDPSSGAMYAASVFAGLGQIGMIITSLSLVTGNASPELRGSISGYYSVMGGLGILFISQVGGQLFDAWFEPAPFVILGALHAVVAIAAFFIPRKNETNK